MTGKRFYVDKSPITHLYVPYDKEQEFVFEGVENGSTIMKLVGLLNNALEENEQLKIQIDDVNNESIGYEEQIEKLLKKNEQLKKERNHFERKKTEYLTEWNTCRIQNTELKKDNQELKEAMKRMMIEMMGGKMND